MLKAKLLYKHNKLHPICVYKQSAVHYCMSSFIEYVLQIKLLTAR